MGIIGSLDEYRERAIKLHAVISINRENQEIRMGVPSARYWDDLAVILRRAFFRKPFLTSTRNWVRSIVLGEPEAFVLLAPYIRLELIVDGKVRHWDGWGKEITRDPESPIDFLKDKLGPYLLEFLLGQNKSLFKGVLENI